MPYYKITTTIPADGEGQPVTRVRAIDAKNEAKALKHVLADTVKVEALTVAEAMKLAQDGVKLEQASA